MKKLALVLAVFVCALSLFVLTSCGKTYELAVVTDVGSLMDGGFNQGTYEGVKNYAEANGKTYKYYQPANGANATNEDRIDAMRQAVKNGAKVIVTPGFMQEKALLTVVPENPDVKFVFVDGWNMGFKNLVGISYKEQESGFFAGYAAVKDGYTKLGGIFGGGGTNPACNRFAYGFAQGASVAAIEMGKVVDFNITYNNADNFAADDKITTQMDLWYGAGTEVVFSCGGSIVESVLASAGKGANRKVIGVDVDQASLSDKIITSAVKGLSASVELALAKFYEGKWDAELADKCLNLGAAEDSTGLPTADGSWRFSTFKKSEYEALFNLVKAGTIKIDATAIAVDNAKSATVWGAIDLALLGVNIHFE